MDYECSVNKFYKQHTRKCVQGKSSLLLVDLKRLLAIDFLLRQKNIQRQFLMFY